MTGTITRVLGAVDRDAIRREARELRAQLKNYEDLLALLDRIEAQAPAPEPSQDHSQPAEPTNTGRYAQLGLSEKRDVVLDVLRARPGQWTTGAMRRELERRGIDAEAGTPVKNIFWHLAKAGTIEPKSKGVYEFPAPTEGAINGQEVLAA